MEKPPQPLNIAIIGGSVAGLISGILLKRNGHNVQILERASSSEREGMAAGVGLSLQFKRFFDVHDRLNDVPMGVANPDVRIVDKQFNVKYTLPIEYNMTTWDAAYYRLRANFDAMESSYCPRPPPADATDGDAVFLTGKAVTSVNRLHGGVVLSVNDTRTGQTEQINADLVIAADGANSGIRKQFHPNLRREEPGYVIWRGTVPTSLLSEEVLDKIENKCIIYPANGSYTYCIMYTIPGENGTLVAGSRHVNLAWYFWPTSTSLAQIMTGTDGHLHRTTVPKGQLQPDIWAAQLEVGRRVFPPEVFAVLRKIPQPFVSIVASIAAPQAAYFDDRLFLIGDALTQVQPNVGMGGNLAATAAISLAEMIGPVEKGLPTADEVAKWQHKVLESTQIMRVRSVAFASWYLCSWVSIGWYYARFYAVYWWQRWFQGRKTKWTLFRDS